MLSPDVGPEAMTSGISENPNLTNPNVDQVEEPIMVQPNAEEDDHEDQGSEQKTEKVHLNHPEMVMILSNNLMKILQKILQ